MDRTALFTFVRDVLETDATDLPDSVLKVYAEDGFRTILNEQQQWRHLESSDTLACVVNQQPYTISTAIATDVNDIRTIVNTSRFGQTLEYAPLAVLEAAYAGVNNTSGEPLYWTLWGTDTLLLYPKPSSTDTLSVRYYRAPLTTWLTDVEGDVVIDLPLNFHIPLANFVVARSYLKQEDPDMGSVYMQAYAHGLDAALKDERHIVPAFPAVYGGGRRFSIGYDELVRRSV